MTKRQIIERGRSIFKAYGIKYRFRKDTTVSGCYPKDSNIQIGYSGYTEREIACAICHELAHVLNFREKKYYTYHNHGSNTRTTKKSAIANIRTGLKAELYTDKRAKKLMKKYFPVYRYWAGYSDKTVQYWYRKSFLGQFREFLKG